MDPQQTQAKMPDVHVSEDTSFAALDWVGMTDIEAPVMLETADGTYRQAARVDAQVSLDMKPQRGAHMSRLYLIVQEGLSKKTLSVPLLRDLVKQFLQTHEGLSQSARLEVRLQWPVKRHALKSDNEAWRTYPVALSVENFRGTEKIFLETTVTYSSTCPASAALSRQLIQENFREHFAKTAPTLENVSAFLGTTEGINATPHAQRSLARVKVQLASGSNYQPMQLVDLIEEALQTASQAAVKREDEQEFARRNGQNLMFCEDAARRVKRSMDKIPDIVDYLAEMKHLESLHPHNAVSTVSKGVPQGLRRF